MVDEVGVGEVVVGVVVVGEVGVGEVEVGEVGVGLPAGISVPVQDPLGTSETFVTSSGLMVPLMSMGLGWISSRSDLISESST